MKRKEAKGLVGCCGLYCGLCSKYQSPSASRCLGCGPGEQHSWCSIWNCCVKKRGFETCAECPEVFRCDIFVRRKVAQWIPVVESLNRIKEEGLKEWLTEQMARQRRLDELLADCNEGRSMSFYCKACARMPLDLIDRAVQEAKKQLKTGKIDQADVKSRARVLKTIIRELAVEASIDLSDG